MSAIPRQDATYDERRNTSRVWPVAPQAFTEARRVCEAWARAESAHFRWLMDGHPTLTEAEHVERFGATYKKYPRRA